MVAGGRSGQEGNDHRKTCIGLAHPSGLIAGDGLRLVHEGEPPLGGSSLPLVKPLVSIARRQPGTNEQAEFAHGLSFTSQCKMHDFIWLSCKL